jgi:hypothetical protein
MCEGIRPGHEVADEQSGNGRLSTTNAALQRVSLPTPELVATSLDGG